MIVNNPHSTELAGFPEDMWRHISFLRRTLQLSSTANESARPQRRCAHSVLCPFKVLA